MEVCIKLWLEQDGQVLFGEGRLQLLEALDRTGSLAGAARELGMSYRAAWGRLRASEKRLGFALVERGEGGRRAMRLTPAARRLMTGYAQVLAEARDFAQRAGRRLRDALAAGKDER